MKRISATLFSLGLSASALASENNMAEFLNPSDLEQAIEAAARETLSVESSKTLQKKDRSVKKYVVVHKLDDKVIEKFRDSLRSLVVDYDDKNNKDFQTIIKNIRQKAYNFFVEELRNFGQANRSEEQNKIHFAKIWKDAINSIYEVERDGGLSEDRDHDYMEGLGEQAGELALNSKTFKTTLLNILLRHEQGQELDLKVQTLIENGADKNLHKEFLVSPKMQNQTEYPLRIALNEIESPEVRFKVLKILLNDSITYSYNKLLDSMASEQLQPVSVSLQVESNKDYLLERLLEKKDFPTFNEVLSYLESSHVFVIQNYEDKISQIEDQIYCPILETVLGKMRDLRNRAISSDKDGKRVDNIHAVLSSKHFKGHLSQDNHDSRFGSGFRNRLKLDFQDIFSKIAKQIDDYRNETEIHGEELQPLVIEWTMWANFRNRIASHLNKFALEASNNANKSNVIRLIRYTNIYNQSSIGSDDDELFRELHEFGGKDIIFMKRNKYGWTPLMYAMMQKQAQGIQLYLRQAPHEITLTDGVDNNILHMAFPLPEQFYQDENRDKENNVLQMVGLDTGKMGFKEKTEEAIKAILTEKSVDKHNKIKALKQLSASNFTPVSLAAAMGYVDIYEYLKEFLKGEGQWNRDDHAHLDTHIEELMVMGLKNYIHNKGSALTVEERAQLQEEIDTRQQELDTILQHSIDEIYHPESIDARQYMDLIMDPVVKILDNYEDQKGTKRGKAPYVTAFEAAFQEMLHPSPIKVKVMAKRPVVREEKKVVLKQTYAVKNKHFFSPVVNFVKGKKDKWEQVEVVDRIKAEESYETEAYKDSPLKGMQLSRSVVKASYLGQVVKFVTTRYLRHHVSPKHLSFDVVYKGLTENETKDFFSERFNHSVELRMQEIIRDTLKIANRLREDDGTAEVSNNRFDNMDGGRGIVDDIDAFADDASQSSFQADEIDDDII